MFKTVIVSSLIFLLLAPFAATAQDENPTIAILRYGSSSLMSLAEKGMLDMLHAYELVNDEERAVLAESQDLDGEHISVIYRDAGYDLPTANIMVEEALDREADVLVTLATTVSQIAANITADMDDPPPIIFAIVTAPYFAGIADSPCVKASNVAGTQTSIPYEDMMSLLPVQDPDMKVIGTIETGAEPNSVYGVARITELAEAMGMSVEVTGVVTMADLKLATEALLGRGVDAIVNPAGLMTSVGLPTIVEAATEHGGVPVFSVVAQHVYRNAMIGAGYYSFYREGVIAGRMLTAHLNGDVDLGRTAINQTPGFTIAINLDSARDADVEISEELLAMADWTVEDGESTAGVTTDLPEVGIELPDMPLEERRAADLEFLQGLHCTDEMIASEKAANETQWGEG